MLFFPTDNDSAYITLEDEYINQCWQKEVRLLEKLSKGWQINLNFSLSRSLSLYIYIKKGNYCSHHIEHLDLGQPKSLISGSTSWWNIFQTNRPNRRFATEGMETLCALDSGEPELVGCCRYLFFVKCQREMIDVFRINKAAAVTGSAADAPIQAAIHSCVKLPALQKNGAKQPFKLHLDNLARGCDLLRDAMIHSTPTYSHENWIQKIYICSVQLYQQWVFLNC